jgi:hypothetical protein
VQVLWEGSLMGTARPLLKADELVLCQRRCARLKTRLLEERKLRKEAEVNAARFQALMLQARVALIVGRKDGSP